MNIFTMWVKSSMELSSWPPLSSYLSYLFRWLALGKLNIFLVTSLPVESKHNINKWDSTCPKAQLWQGLDSGCQVGIIVPNWFGLKLKAPSTEIQYGISSKFVRTAKDTLGYPDTFLVMVWVDCCGDFRQVFVGQDYRSYVFVLIFTDFLEV